MPAAKGDRFNRVLVFTATYNEADNIRSLLTEIWNELPHADILVIDDNSPDGTGVILDEMAKTHHQLSVIHRPSKLGLGTAHHLAMLFAMKHHYDALITMDADHSHNPADLPRLLEKLSTADFVIGSRYAKGGSCLYKGYRKFLSVCANTAARFLLGIPLHEFTTSYRAFRVNVFSNVNFVKMHNPGYSFFMESVYRFNQAGLTLAEVPICFRSRHAGNSKIPSFEIVRGMFKLVHLIMSRMLQRKMPVASPEVKDTCAHCHANFLSEYYPRQLNNIAESNQSNAFRCSSMAHTNKPYVVKCLQCSFIQVPRSEHPQSLDTLYADVVDQHYLSNLSSKRKTFARAYQRIKPFLPRTGSLLEVGSYCGLFLSEAKKHGWDALGIEPSRWAASYAKTTFGHEIINGSLEPVASTLKKEFDVVVSWDVLEHVQNPTEYLKIINSKLKDGGTVALSTLDISAWFPRLTGQRWPWIIEMHLFYFDSAVLEDIFRHAGFEMVRIEPYRHYASLRYIYQKICALFPAWVGRVFLTGSKLIPDVSVPVTLGDIKLYIGKKIHAVTVDTPT